MTDTSSITLLFLFNLILILSLISRSFGGPYIVKTLPGYPGDLPFTLETGYIGVSEEEQVKLFYYFIESERDVEMDPLMIWLTGGPGCSGLSKMLFEIGPFGFNFNASNSEPGTPTLRQNPYAWTKVANMIFIDSPVGTGFSYATNFEAYHSTDTLQATHILEFLRKWLIEHPKFSQSSLYISGDSFGGMIVPIVVQEIVQANKIGVTPKLNLKGYVLGNPLTTPYADKQTIYEYANRISLISDELYKSAMISCNGDFDNVDAKNTRCLKLIQLMQQDLKSIAPGYVLGDKCVSLSPKPRKKISQQANPLLVKGYPCLSQHHVLSHIWANDEKVREALHIKEGSIGLWSRCNKSLAYTRNVKNATPYHVNVSRESLEILVYSGDQDMLVPYTGTHKWIKELNVPITDDWRPWFVDGQVAGYSTEFSILPYRLVHTTIKGGGHLPADVNPRQCFAMIDRWFSLSPL